MFSTGNISSCSSLFMVAVVGAMLIPPCAQACTANLSAAVQAVDTDTLQFTVCDLFRINMSQVAFNPSSNQCSLQCQTSNHIVHTMKRAGLCIKIKLCRGVLRLRRIATDSVGIVSYNHHWSWVNSTSLLTARP